MAVGGTIANNYGYPLTHTSGFRNLSPMPQPTPTTEAIAFWAAVFVERFPDCMTSLNQIGPQGCAQLAAEQADAALVEFNKRFGTQS